MYRDSKDISIKNNFWEGYAYGNDSDFDHISKYSRSDELIGIFLNNSSLTIKQKGALLRKIDLAIFKESADRSLTNFNNKIRSVEKNAIVRQIPQSLLLTLGHL